MHAADKHIPPVAIPTGDRHIQYAPDQETLQALLESYAAGGMIDFFLADTHTASLCLPQVKDCFPGFGEARLMVIEAGEAGKTPETLHRIWKALLEGGAGRQSRLFIVGGGTVTDSGGFAASTFRRGIPFIHIPTTLLAMADAAIGGKTAVNLGPLKNQAGTFAFPEAVIIHPPFLLTLPEEELLSGYAEMVKTAIVADKDLFEALLQMDANAMGRDKLVEAHGGGLIMKAALLKAGICVRDPFDRGSRQVLNFGHSVGHALESLYGSRGQLLRHGFAVAAGMVCESFMAMQLAGLPAGQQRRIEEYLLATFPAVDYSKEDLSEILHLMGYDKKNERGGLRLSLPESIGSCRTGVACTEALVVESLSYYLEITKSPGR